jgi:hypothetical protein
VAKKNPRIWDYMNAITETKDLSVLTDPDFNKVYVPFVINRGLGQHQDAVLAANQMNIRPDLSPKLQFLFLLNTLRARRRYGNWLKSTVPDDVKAVAEYYDCSLRRAQEIVSLHTPEQLADIYRRIDKGGVLSKGRSHGTPQRDTAPCGGGDTRVR